jgi:3-deoxy-D-arabino-heptulosonate 7-phosphate (DAHP) synthase
VIVDPSHAAGERDKVAPLARAAAEAGAHGLIIEVHEDPGAALSDSAQSLRLEDFRSLMSRLSGLGRKLARPAA